MTHDQKSAIKAHLLERLEELLAVSPLREVTAETCADENEYASRLSEQTLNVALRERETRQIREIKEALTRIDSFGFGQCDECGEDIGLARLMARPTALLCVRCQAECEKGMAHAI